MTARRQRVCGTTTLDGTRVPLDVAAKLAERVSSEDLTARESEVLRLIVAGNSNREIAALLGISEGTVKTHINHILLKLGVGSYPSTESLSRQV